MRLRHKQPTLVSMWMLDVFCCALGCVILLLLLKMREANFTAAESIQVQSDLNDTQLALSDSDARNITLGAEISDREGKLALLQTDRDKLAKELALVRTERDKAAKNLAAVEEKLKVAESELALVRAKSEQSAKMLARAKERDTANNEELAKKQAEMAELSRKLAAALKQQDAAQMLVRDREKSRDEANDRLSAAESKLKKSAKQIDELLTKSGDAAQMRARISELEKQLADSNLTIIDLQGNKAKLADKVNKLQIESEQRFAGIAMTGKNVVFLVDMSGSMDRTDENTINESKWPTVRDTLLKVMRSLPNLEQFQVILFSSKYNYLLGNEGRWLVYEKEKSIDQVRRAMTATKPVGDTNLYTAFDETFRFRGKGLDTVYLFSDGLPTSGPGLTASEERTLKEADRGIVLARVLRRAIKSNWNIPDSQGQRVRVNSIGFFYESPDVGAFLWALSRDNDGSFVGMSRP